MRSQKGSITIFSLLSLLLISATLFALLEGTRYQEIRRFTYLQTKAALESVFANYNSCLWENYHLLGTDIRMAETLLEQQAVGSAKGENSWLQIKPENISVIHFTRLTDGEGAVFLQSVSEYMKENLLYESLKEIYSQYESIKTLLEKNEMNIEDISEAIEGIKTADSEEMQNSIGMAGQTSIDILDVLEKVKNWQEKGILELVLKDTQVVSDAEEDFKNGVLVRELNAGNMPVQSQREWTDRVLLQQYLLTYLSNFRETESHRALSYEVEYLLVGKSSDVANLKSVVGKLLVIREAANFLYLISCPEMVAKVESLTTLYLGATLNPVLVQAVKVGLLTAWAFVESILDVRTLLAGKKIPLLKSETSWTSQLENIAMLTDGFVMAKESDFGLTYQGYLGILLLFEQELELAMQTMNLQEASIRRVYGDETFRIDTLVTQVEVNISYRYKPLFPFLHIVNAEDKWKYSLAGRASYNYY